MDEIPEDGPEDHPGDQPDSIKQLVPFKPMEEIEELEVRKIEDFIPLPDELVQKPPPTLKKIQQEASAKDQAILVPGAKSIASYSGLHSYASIHSVTTPR